MQRPQKQRRRQGQRPIRYQNAKLSAILLYPVQMLPVFVTIELKHMKIEFYQDRGRRNSCRKAADKRYHFQFFQQKHILPLYLKI